MKSLVVAVKAAVIDGLALVVDSSTECTYGYQFGTQAAERVYTGRSGGETPAAAMRAGRNYRNESGTFDLNILVEAPGGGVQDAEERVDEIGVTVEEWIADRKSDELGIGLTSLRVARWSADYFPSDSGITAVRTYTVAWTARLT